MTHHVVCGYCHHELTAEGAVRARVPHGKDIWIDVLVCADCARILFPGINQEER